MVLDPIPQSLPVHFFGSRPQPPTSPHRMCVEQDLAKVTEEPYIRSKQLYVYSKETYIHCKESYIRNSPQDVCRAGSRKSDRRALHTLKSAVRKPK